MNNKAFLIFLFLLILLAGSTSAATDTVVADDVYRVNSQINYAKPCFYNGTYCSGSAQCNFTVFDPDGDVIIDGETGTNKGTYHNVSITFTEIGLYKIDMVCLDNSLYGSDTFYAQVSGDGFNSTTGFYLLIVIFSLGLIGLGLYKEDATITLLGSFGLFFLGIYILFNGVVGIKDATTTWATGLITLGVAAYVSIRSGLELITN